MSTPRSFDLVALGEAMVEFNQTVAGQPQHLRGFGGDTRHAVIDTARDANVASARSVQCHGAVGAVAALPQAAAVLARMH